MQQQSQRMLQRRRSTLRKPLSRQESRELNDERRMSKLLSSDSLASMTKNNSIKKMMYKIRVDSLSENIK